jgi:hypothetical protein
MNATLIAYLVTVPWLLPAQTDSRVDRHERELQALENRVSEQEEETGDLWAALREQEPPCSAQLVPISGTLTRTVGTGEDAVVGMNLLATVSQPRSRCLPASVWVTVSYLDAEGSLICTGSVENVATQGSQTGTVTLEIRPRSLVNFVRWVNQPPRTDRGALAIACRTPDGLVEIRALPEAASALALRVSLFPPGGGLASVDYRLDLR